MLRNLFKDRKGFTLIEVVIVLAIAGLIFVIVFLAVSQAQATRRDTARKADMNRLVAAINQYSSNLNGAVPTDQTTIDTVRTSYLTNFNDPGGGAYATTFNATGTAPGIGVMYYANNRTCNGAVMTVGASGTTRSFAVVTYLERGGSACQDNQ